MAPGVGGSGGDDFAAMFDILDLSRRGYLDADEIQTFYESVFYKPVGDTLVKLVLRNHGGSPDGSTCLKPQFEEVLLKLEEQRVLEDSLYWDFIALDKDGYQLVAVKSCLLLARSAQQDFSLELWHSWLNSRADPQSPISWTEFQAYLHFSFGNLHQQSSSDEVLDQEFHSLDEKEQSTINQKYNQVKQMMEDDDDYVMEVQHQQELYQEDVKHEAVRLTNRWNYGGVEAVIYDDGGDMERPAVTTEMKNVVSLGDLLSALEIKYNMLRHTILLGMAKAEAEYESPGMAVGSAVVEKYVHDMKKKEKQIRKLQTLDQMLTLPQSGIQYSFTAHGVMAETADAYLEKWEKAQQRFNALREQGKTSDEINKIYEKEILSQMRGSNSSGELLIHLAKREEEEKQSILKKLKNSSPDAHESEKMKIYASIHIQCIRMEHYEEFEFAALSGCLAERNQSDNFDRYHPDHSRQERLSKFHIDSGKSQSLGHRLPETAKPDVSHSKTLGLVDSWLEMTRLLTQKHSAERKMLIHFLLNNKLEADLISIKNEPQKELQAMRRELMKQNESWKETSFQKSNASDKVQQRARHNEILSTAVALYWENIRRLTNRNADKISKVILARLQVLQDIESQKIFNQMKQMNVADIYDLRKEIYRLIKDEHLENLTDLVLGSVKITAEEKELVDLILSKYDKLRLKLFEGYLRRKDITDEAERKDFLEKLRVGEEKNRQAGNHAKLAKLCKETFQINYSMQEVMGPEASRFSIEVEAYLEELKISNRKRKFISEPPDLGNDPDPTKARGNLISELHLRYEDEVDAVLDRLREANPSEKSFLIAAESAWQQWEILRFNLDDEFIKSALVMGLCERMKISDGKIKLRQDNLRYVRLAQERLMTSTTLSTKSLQSMSSFASPVNSALRRVLLCHASDWKKLYDLLDDGSAEELREAASSMTEDERTSRIAEINTKRLELDTKSPDWQEDIIALLEEAAAIKYITRMETLKRLGGQESGVDVTSTDIYTSMMADLQEEHDKDGLKWFKMALEDPTSASEIKDKAMSESKICFNIFNVLCKYEGQADDDEILQALEDKYDSLRDKLLAEALMKQLGEKAWREMSERERQARIFKLKMEERRMRREGKYDELAKLLGDAAANEERLRNLMGMSREEYERKLQERLKMRKRGVAGLAALGEDDEEEGDVEEGGDPLVDLTARYEQEKEALLKMLAGQGARYLSEQERQRELARLRRELRKAEREEKFGAAAMVLGLAERNAEMEKRLSSDKKRQEELAKQRIAALKAKMKKGKQLPTPEISEEDEKIVRNGNKTDLMDAVLAKQELLFEAERAWLVHILNAQNELKPDQTGVKEKNPAKLASVRTSSSISERLHEINVKLPNQVSVHEYRMPLTEASFFREALLSQELMVSSPDEARSKEALDIKTVALLQEVQDRMSRSLTEEMSKLNEQKLIEMQEMYLKWTKSGISENIPTTLFTVVDEEDMLEKALEGKYDAVLAALVEKALIEKKGEKKWNSMSDPDRDRLIAETTQKIKKLLAEGKTEEALNLLGEYGKAEPNAILAMLGLNSEDEEKKKLEDERQNRKQQRIEEGMSEEEADKLMEEEKKNDEEALKKRKRSILELLQYDLEAQKAALMKQFAEANDRLNEERRRQLELAKLRLQQRMMQRENDVHAVVQLMALSKFAEDKLDSERKRQLELAKRRLEEFRKGRKTTEDKVLPLKLPDGDDINGLIEAIIRELEAKHAEERSTLMQLLAHDASVGTENRKNASKLDLKSMKTKIVQLCESRKQWRNGDPESLSKNSEQQMTILREAAALNLELLIKGKSVTTEEEAQEEVLAKLQKQQMLESSQLINGLPEKNVATLRVIAQEQWKARSEKWLDNVAETLLHKSDVSSEEEQVVKALEEKYDAMKDKLIAEALIKQVGEKEWQNLSEQERQRKIMELKIQERKLRQEGKMDEAAALMASLIKSEEDVARILGEAKLSQKEELEKRLEKRKQLKEQRLAAGLAVDDATLDAELEKADEEERKRRRNVLLSLEQNFDEEREAILAGLRRQDEVIGAERKRQLELARLRREQKLIAREDQFHAAAIIFNHAKRREEILAENMADARARQLALAKERIASRKARKEEREAAMKLFDLTAVTERLIARESETHDASLSAPERLLQQMDIKQVNEREDLLLLLLATEMDSNMRMEVSSMTDAQIKTEQEKIMNERKEWREKRFVDLLQGKEEEDEGRRNKKRDHLAQSIVDQNNNTKRCMILKLEAEKRSKSGAESEFSNLKNKASVSWLADIQTSQESSVDAVNTLIADKSDEVLDMISYGQRKSRIESWNDDIAKVVMGILPPGQMVQPVERQASSLSTGSSEQRAIEETEKQMESLDQELEEQKKELENRKRIGEDIDMDAALAALQGQHDARRKALSSDLERQKQKIQDRLRARRERKDELEYEAHAAAAMVFMAERRLQDQKAHQEGEKERHKTMMEQRLEERRKRREEAKRRQEEEEAAALEREERVKKTASMLPPGARLKREKTVIDIQISSEEKEKMLKEMQEISKNMQEKMIRDQELQREKVRKRINRNAEQKRDKVERMFANFQREQTMVLEKRDLEMKRQKTLLQERMHDIRTGKTKTMKERADQQVRDFDKLVNPEESEGMTKDERMALAAKNLQQKLLDEKDDISKSRPTSTEPTSSDNQLLTPRSSHSERESSPNLSSRRPSMVTEEDRVKIMKRRASLKKKQKQEEGRSLLDP